MQAAVMLSVLLTGGVIDKLGLLPTVGLAASQLQQETSNWSSKKYILSQALLACQVPAF